MDGGVVQKKYLVEGEDVRAVFGEIGIHPFLFFEIKNSKGDWVEILRLGARHLKNTHSGASFPRVFIKGREFEPLQGVEIEEGGSDGRYLTLRDSREGLKVKSVLSCENEKGIFKVIHEIKAETDIGVNRIFDRYDFVAATVGAEGVKLSYSFVPNLRPAENMLIGDHVFRSPVVIAETDLLYFALIPDLDILSNEYSKGVARYYLDYLAAGGENCSPTVCFGIGNTIPKGHVYFKSRFSKEIRIGVGDSLKIGYYILLGKSGKSVRRALSFMWRKFGKKYFSSCSPQVVSLDRYASAGLKRIFKSHDIFRIFEIDGQRCGGTVGIHFAAKPGVQLMNRKQTENYLKNEDKVIFVQRHGLELLSSRPWGVRILERITYSRGTRVPPQIFFQSWYCNLRSAYGAYWFAKKWDDQELMENALAVKNLSILAPKEEGLFPAVCFATDDGIFWSKGTMAFKHIDEYHIPDCATTAYYMVLWYKDLEGDPRLLKRARELADFIVRVQLPNGAIPAWVSPAPGKPRISQILKESASTACPAMFLAALYNVEPEEKYLNSAKKGCDFILSEVVPSKKWFDYETFFSCSHKRIDFYDYKTNTPPQNTMSMYWTAEALRLLFLLTEEEEYLRAGLKILDELCLYQQVWDPPFLNINGFGGFGVMNTDAEWNDARQALFSTLLMDYYRLTGNPEYMERGISALRASFTLMYIDENKKVAPGNLRLIPSHEIGSVAENYGHFGFDYRTTGILQSDWGAGSACFAAAYALKNYGDVYVDVSRGRAFGINGCAVDGFSIKGNLLNLSLSKQIEQGIELTVRLSEPEETRFEIEINGKKASRQRDGSFKAYI